MVSYQLSINQTLKKLANRISIIILELDTIIQNIKIGLINNHVVNLMEMMINFLQLNNGKYGKLKWKNETHILEIKLDDYCIFY